MLKSVPELPEVETVRRALQPVMEGARILRVVVRRPDLRTPFHPEFVAHLEGQTIVTLARRAKYLVARLSSGEALAMHLGMSGSFRIARATSQETPGRFQWPRSRAGAHDHVTFWLSSGVAVTFNDPRRFGSMALVDAATGDAMFAKIGPEPLSNAFDAHTLARACAGRKTSIKAALLDQQVVAGVGNIYASEALHRAGLSPHRLASSIATGRGLPRPAAIRLAAAVKRVLTDAIARAATAPGQNEALGLDGSSAAPDRFRVYDREGLRCRRPGCPGTIRRIVQTGRATFFCPRCQR